MSDSAVVLVVVAGGASLVVALSALVAHLLDVREARRRQP